MPGLDRSRIVGKNYEELVQFTCNICLMVFTEPMVTQCCRQLYCKQCIHEWLKNHDICPSDRRPMSMNELSPASRPFINLLNEVKVKCDFHTKGCTATPVLEKLNEHTKICEFNLCQFCGFKENDLRNQLSKSVEQRREIERLKRDNARIKRSLTITERNNSVFKLRIFLALVTIVVLTLYFVASIFYFNFNCTHK